MAGDADSIRDRRRELMRKRIAESGITSTEPAEHIAAEAGQPYPLSSGQRRMWFLQTLAPTDPTLNIGVGYRLSGAIDEGRLRDAASAVLARHAILRTTYGTDSEGVPYQQFKEHVELPWQSDDLSGLPESERNQRVESITHTEFGRPFDLSTELPIRLTLVRLATDEAMFLIVAHHICWDDESWPVFFTDLNAAYNGRRLDPHAPQYLVAEVLGARPDTHDNDIRYWRDNLASLPGPVEFPGATSTSPSRTAAHTRHRLPDRLYEQVGDFARQHSATPFMVLLAAFGAVIRRYTGATDFLVGVPVVNRSARAQGAIGYFGNTLLLRITAGATDTFETLAARVRDTCRDGYAHQGTGVDVVVREVNPDRTSRHDGLGALASLGFSMRGSVDGIRWDGIDAEQMGVAPATTEVPLSLTVVSETDGVFLELEYQTEVLSSRLVDQFVRHLERLLTEALADPSRRLAETEMLDAGERTALLTMSRGDLVETPATTLVSLLETVAAKNAHRCAVVSDDEELTYTELHRRSNRLARWLVGNGAGAENIIGLQLGTSVEFLVAALAVLKSGAAYLPIDPAYPADRIDYLIGDTDPHMVLGREGIAAAETAAARHSDADLSDADRIRPLRPENLAYVIYTSGSTGQPKGVAVAHRAIADHLIGFVAEWNLTAEDRLLQSSSVSFDASLADIFMPLTTGATLVVPKAGAMSDIDYVAATVDRHGVTVLHMVPSMLDALLHDADPGRWRNLRHIPVGGEALPGPVADRFSRLLDAELRNHYGPTEAVVCSTHHAVTKPYGDATVPIGIPNRNVHTYVLDQALQPVPAGVTGELYLGGQQLARGYLRQPALTSARFVADPFTAGGRLYRTGDLVFRNHAGELEFVGRADDQVKIRGFRIELGEVESVVGAHPAVRQCVAAVVDGEHGPVLAAYIVPAAEIALDEVRAHAAAKLPAYMLPSAYALIPSVPLMVNGKLDKKALPIPTRAMGTLQREPRTPTESRMCAIFGALFGDRPVGAEDSFFELGGHSLLAARLVAQIRSEFGVDLTVRAVFDAPTPAGLASQLVEQFRAEFDIDLDEIGGEEPAPTAQVEAPQEADSIRPELTGAGRHNEYPLSYSQLATWFQHRLGGPRDAFNLPLALRIDGPLNLGALTDAFNDVVERHDALRTTFAEHDGLPYQIVHAEWRIELPEHHIRADEIDERISTLRREVLHPENGPLIRAELLTVDATTHVLVAIVHHIVGDHRSLEVVVDDLIEAYRARHAGRAPRWAELPVQFGDYARWQREAFDVPSDWGAREIAHWRDALAGLPDEVMIAPERPRGRTHGQNEKSVAHFLLPAERRRGLLELARATGASEFMVYQAVVAALLHKLGAGTDIAVGSPVAARVDEATSELVGLFANVIALRTDLTGDPALREIVDRSRDTVLDAFAHQEVPIERLVEAIKPTRSAFRNPFYQNTLHFRGGDWVRAGRALVDSGTTSVEVIPLDLDVSLLDLDIAMAVTPAGEVAVRTVANAELFDSHLVTLIADALRATLDAFATEPDSAISTLEVLPAESLAALLTPPPVEHNEEPSPAPAVAGSAETEAALISILEELLEITGVERDDNFFALGGDSIIAIKWSAQAAKQGLALTPAMVFECMTIGDLAAAVDSTDAPAEPASDQPEPEYTPMSASGLSAEALSDLTAAWQQN